MKNFGILYYYEIKKLLKRPLLWAVLFLLTAAAFAVSSDDTILVKVRLAGITLPDGEELSFREWAVRAHKNGIALNGTPIDDSFFRDMEAALPDTDNVGIRFWCYENDSPYSTFFETMCGNYPRNVSSAEFYSLRRELVEERWDNHGLTDGEKAYWIRKEERLSQPYIYREPWPGITVWLDGLPHLLILFVLAAAVCLCPAFSEDQRLRVDRLVFASRESRLPLGLAKLSAGFTAGVLAGAVLIAGNLAGAFAAWGSDGLDAPFQMVDLTCSNSFRISDVILCQVLMMILFCAVCSVFTMLVSAFNHSTIAALAIPFPAFFFLLGIRTPDGRCAVLFPQYTIGRFGISELRVNRLCGVYLDAIWTFMLLCMGLLLALSALCWLCWRRNAVQKR